MQLYNGLMYVYLLVLLKEVLLEQELTLFWCVFQSKVHNLPLTDPIHTHHKMMIQ